MESTAEPLAQTVSLARPSGLIWKQLEAAGRWAIRFPANDGVVFTCVVEGSCLCNIAGAEMRLEPGDFLMLVRPPTWILGSEAGVEPIDYSPDHPHSARLVQGEGPPVTIMGGRFVLDELAASLLLELLPAQTLLHAAGGGVLGGLLEMLSREAKAMRPGREFVLERLMELLMVEAIRDPQASPQAHQPGLLQGLAHPQIGKAIEAMHTDAAHRWTVAELAAHAGMSRSGFAAHFAAIVGMTPIDYLSRWRMALAKKALSGGSKLAEVADAVGYQSVSAFSTAFTKAVGCPPSVFASNARQ